MPKHIRWSKQLAQPTADLDIPGGTIARIDGYTVLHKNARILSFQPHMHIRGKRQCLELIYPTSGPSAKTEIVNCANFNYNWHLNYTYTDDAAPLVPAGTILHIDHAGTTTRPATRPTPIRRTGWATVSARSTRWASRGSAGTTSPTRSTRRKSRHGRPRVQKNAKPTQHSSSNSSSSSGRAGRAHCGRRSPGSVSPPPTAARTFSCISIPRKVPYGNRYATVVLRAALIVGLGLLRRRRRHRPKFDNNFKYNSGQDVQPVFEGWSKTADGGF